MATDPTVESQTWGLSVPYHWRDYSAWRLISELSRRHPGHYSVTERPYMGGHATTVWHLTEGEVSRSIEGQILINNTGSVTIWEHSAQCPDSHRGGLTDRFATLDVMFTDDLEDLVRKIEACAGLERKTQTLETTDETISHRLIAEALGQTLHSRVHMRVKGFLYDNSRPRFDWSGQFMHLHHHKLEEYTSEELEQSWGQLVFLFDERDLTVEECEPATPILAIELDTGLAFTRTTEFSLMPFYESCHRDISRAAFELVRRARQDA